MRPYKQIHNAIKDIGDNSSLTYSYREDVIAVLKWVIGGEDFDGLFEKKSNIQLKNEEKQELKRARFKEKMTIMGLIKPDSPLQDNIKNLIVIANEFDVGLMGLKLHPIKMNELRRELMENSSLTGVGTLYSLDGKILIEGKVIK